ncbi:hypothetical protein [Rhodanobacter sp. FW106-PBR-R2A-1-13]|uniref:hypothetical protein n=1 Tax=Rhodanobacter sp. FW106-PBR-R2A-1-13 TaxID=3454845 RepID=UPI0034E532AB
MFESLKSLGKAAIGLAIETPLALVKDVATLGGAITDRKEPYTVKSLKRVMKNVHDAADPD